MSVSSPLFRRESLPVVSEVTPTNHADFINIDEIVVIAYLPSDSEFAQIFNTVAEKQHVDYVFGLSIDPANAEAANVSPPAIVVYRTFDEPRTEFPNPVSGFSVEEISDWLTELSIPAIHRVDDENYFLHHGDEPLVQLLLHSQRHPFRV
jgi:protein disulfide-isomerase A1